MTTERNAGRMEITVGGGGKQLWTCNQARIRFTSHGPPLSSVTPAGYLLALLLSFCYASMKGAIAFSYMVTGGPDNQHMSWPEGTSESRDSHPTPAALLLATCTSAGSPEKLTCTKSPFSYL